MLLLGFLRSAAARLKSGPIPSMQKHRKSEADAESDDEQDTFVDEDGPSDAVQIRGTVLITLRNVVPYTLW